MQKISLPADREHKGIEIIVPLGMFLGGIVCYFVVNSQILLPLMDGTDLEGFRPLLRLVLAIVLGVAIGAILELILKQIWPSGRLVEVDETGLTAVEKDKTATRIDWEQRVNILRWRYMMRGYPRGGRERRVPTGHLLLAVRLLQDDREVIVHCYLSAKQASQVPGYGRFTSIDMASLYDKGALQRFLRPERPRVSKELVSGKQGPIWAAEKARWAAGFELEFKDFSTLMELLKRHAVPFSAQV